MKIDLPLNPKMLSPTMKAQVIKNLARDFYLEYDLLKLAETYLLASDVLKYNKFPLKAYKKWRKENRYEYYE